ncbi:MAG: DUF1573 domain-containing protein [Gemmataceae bacterium]|nr:DUF1573 domain-containing protein [Gemmataceae bacterium]
MSDQIVVLGPSVIELDRSDRTTPVEAVFTLKNTTSTDAAILGAQSNCSCSGVELDRKTLGPGETMAVRLRVTSFDSQSPRYSQGVVVRTSLGDVPLEVRGRLPETRHVLHRPTVLALYWSRDRAEWADNAREVVLRVPAHCGTPAERIDGQTDLPGVELAVEETANGDADVREFRVRILTRAGVACRPPAEPSLTIRTGCDPVVIPVKLFER